MELVYEIKAAVARAESKLLPRVTNPNAPKTGLRLVAEDPNSKVNMRRIETINFQAGTLGEITQTLNEYSKSEQLRYQKMPIVCLITPFSLSANGDFKQARFTLFIACPTSPHWKRYERQVNSFEPVLKPIVREVIRQILASNSCMTYENDIRYQEIEHDYWSKEGNASIFNEYVDAIEIRDITINFITNNCQ